MLLIPCPYCGGRDESEFSYGGPAIKYPDVERSVSIESWHRVLHLSDNSATVIREYWYHGAGCECWIEINRDLETHEITSPAKTGIEG
jgi:heterotetrameric sarcosine oxidase delta subunit